MATLQLTPEIRDLIRLTVDSAIKATIEQLNRTSTFNPSIQDEEFLSAEQAAHFLKIKLSTLYSKVEKSDLPHYRSGKRKLLFKKTELEAYVAERKSKSNQEIADEVDNYILNK